MRVLVVRPRAQGEATSRRLTLRGHEAVLAPLLTIKDTPSRPPEVTPQAILVTSANAAAAAAEVAKGFPTAPIFAVGVRTAIALRDLGLADVRSADGDGVALARLVASAVLAPATLLHVAGRQRRPEPKRSLEAAGFTVVVQEAYATAPAPALPPSIAAACTSGSLDGVLHYSRASAATLARLAKEAGLEVPLRGLLHVCLSDEVGRGLEPLRPGRLVVAVRPDEDALLAALDEAAEGRDTARATAIGPVGTGTKSPADICRTTKDDSPPMSETRNSDPLKRKPPTIDLKPGEFQTVESTTGQAPEANAQEGAAETAIEPTASLGLDGASAESGQGRKGRTKVSRTGVPVTGTPVSDDPIPAMDKDEAERVREAANLRPPGEEPSTAAVSSEGPPSYGAVEPVHAAAARPAGFGRLLAAGLVGGLAGAALAVGADRLLGGASDGNVERLTALERRVAAPPAAGTATGPAEGRLAAIEGSVRQAVEAATAARGAAETASRQASEALSRPVPAGAPGAGGPDPALRSTLDTLGARLAAVEDVGKRAEASSAAIGTLDSRVETLGRETAAKLTEATAALGTLSERVATLQSTTQALQSTSGGLQSSIQALGVRLTEADSRLSALSGELAKLSPTAVQAGLRVVVAGRVADALRTGAPLGPSLGALERLGSSEDVLSALKPFAAEPPPAASALAAEFKPLAAQVLAEPSAPASSFSDRLLRIADKVVTVRAVGDGSGNDLPGLVARIEGALGRGALPEAARLWDTLPAEPKRLSAAWAERLKRRVAADEAAARLSAETIAALEASTR